jgi:iron complex outermembrane receptor protein
MLWANGYVQWQPFTGFYAKGSSSQAAVRVMNTNYTDGRLDKPWSQYALQLRYLKGKHDWESSASYEQRFGSSGWSSSTGYRYYAIVNSSQSFSPFISLARRYRLPDMNELFWSPGGNPNLKPELGYHARMGLVAFLGKDKRTRWRLEPTIFVSRVNDWIQWVPQDNGVWSPVNFLKVQSQGAEMYVQCEKLTRNDRTNYRFETRWTINDVVELDSMAMQLERRMIYSPRLIGYQGASIQRGIHSATVGYRFVSERFTDEANTPHRALNAYGLCNVWYAVNFKKRDFEFDVTAGVDNIFNSAYETIRAYAMPGRVWRLGLTCSFIQKQKQTEEIHILLD